jgi:replication factor C subunit 1
LKLLKNADDASVKEAIALMDEYGLNREDIAEKIELFAIGKGYDSFEDLDSKQKAAFTREYNAGSHMSQALVQEQGGGGSKRKRNGPREKDPNDLDAIDDDDDDDDVEDDDEENSEDEEKELKKLQEQFKKKGRRAAAASKKAKGKSKKK